MGFVLSDFNSISQRKFMLKLKEKPKILSDTVDAFTINIENDLSLIAVVGEGMRHTPGISGKLFSVLGEKNVNVVAIAQGSSERNISFIIKNDEVKSAIRSLHQYIFSNNAIINSGSHCSCIYN